MERTKGKTAQSASEGPRAKTLQGFGIGAGEEGKKAGAA
jgi:hypothetical protein